MDSRRARGCGKEGQGRATSGSGTEEGLEATGFWSTGRGTGTKGSFGTH